MATDNENLIPNLEGEIDFIPTKTDCTLTKSGYSADAKAVGDKFLEYYARIERINPVNAEAIKYNNGISELKSTNVKAAIDELNDKIESAVDLSASGVSGSCDLLFNGSVSDAGKEYVIDTSLYKFIYYEMNTNGGLCMISNFVPTAVLSAEVKEFNHTEYASASYNAEITVQLKTTSFKAYTKTLVGWKIENVKAYGIK